MRYLFTTLFFLCFMSLQGVYAQDRQVSGTITDDETGEPLIGVSIALEGTPYGAFTDASGVFNVKFPVKAIENHTPSLLISYTGYLGTRIELPERVRYEDLALVSPEMSLGPNSLVLMGDIIVTRPNLFQRLRRAFFPRHHR